MLPFPTAGKGGGQRTVGEFRRTYSHHAASSKCSQDFISFCGGLRSNPTSHPSNCVDCCFEGQRLFARTEEVNLHLLRVGSLVNMSTSCNCSAITADRTATRSNQAPTSNKASKHIYRNTKTSITSSTYQQPTQHSNPSNPHNAAPRPKTQPESPSHAPY